MYFFSKKFRIEVTRSGIRRVIVEYVLETDYFWAGYAPVPNGRYRIHVPAQAGVPSWVEKVCLDTVPGQSFIQVHIGRVTPVG